MKAYYFTLGFVLAMLVAMIIVSHNPEPETEEACGKCGAKAWWFQLAEGD